MTTSCSCFLFVVAHATVLGLEKRIVVFVFFFCSHKGKNGLYSVYSESLY